MSGIAENQENSALSRKHLSATTKEFREVTYICTWFVCFNKRWFDLMVVQPFDWFPPMPHPKLRCIAAGSQGRTNKAIWFTVEGVSGRKAAYYSIVSMKMGTRIFLLPTSLS